MNRLQKKCVIASTGVHLLLALVLVVGPAFVTARDKPDDLPILDFVPVKTVDALVSGGGNPKAQPPAPAPAPDPQPPAPPPPKIAEKQPDPEPPKDPPKEVKPKPEESLEPSLEAKPKKPEISLKEITRPKSSKDDAKAKAEAKAREDALAESQRRIANAIGKVAQNISGNIGGATTVELKGPGGGGVPYANFLQAVKTVYANAWVVPDGVTDDQATAIAAVTIAKNGDVIKARITDRSGNTLVDQSVQATLDRVRFAAPLPDDAKESQRTVTINFNVKAKRGLG